MGWDNLVYVHNWYGVCNCKNGAKYLYMQEWCQKFGMRFARVGGGVGGGGVAIWSVLQTEDFPPGQFDPTVPLST